jgi:RNA polymerase sigma-70 factor (ECF subfamily)
MPEATFEQAYPLAVRAAQVRATAAVLSGAIPSADLEDFEQEGLTACWLALPSFDPARASLRTFVERVVANRIASLARAARRMPVQIHLSPKGRWLVASEAAERDFQADVERLSTAFGGEDRQLVFLLLEHSPAEAGKIMGLPRSTVHQRILRLRRRFVTAGYVPNGDRQ